MKKSLFLGLILLLTACGTAMTPEEKAKQAEKEAAENAVSQAQFEQAVAALESKNFVLEAERVEFKRGAFQYVTPNTNFVSLDGENATIQLALNGPVAGPNGIGGITVEGRASNIKMSTDSKGNVSYSMDVMGVGVSAIVFFRMAKGTNDCTATVTPNFSSNRISFTGSLYPTVESNVYKGRAL